VNAGILPGERIDHIGRSIRGTVVDDNEFKIPEGLRQDALNGISQKRGCIVNWHEYGNIRRS